MTTYEHKLGRGQIEYGAPVRIPRIPERKTGVDVDDLLRQARERVAARDFSLASERSDGLTTTGDGDGDDVPQDGEAPGEDEVAAMEVPEETVTEQTRRAVELSLLCAEECLPPPGPPPGLKVRYQTRYDRGTFGIYAEIKGRPVAVFPVGRGEVGGYWRHQPGQLWVDPALDAYQLVRAVLHEATHAWRHRIGANGMTEAEQEREAWDWAEKLAPVVIEAAAAEGGLV